MAENSSPASTTTGGRAPDHIMTFCDKLTTAEPGWRRFVATAADWVTVPVIRSALAYYDGHHGVRSPANLIQRLEGEIGAHGYRRFDREGSCHIDRRHTGTDPQ